jgi:hypothetical protein
MAQLQSTTATAMSVAGGTVWTAANDGVGSQLDANTIAGYEAIYLDITNNTTTFTLGGNTSTFYPVVFAGQGWGDGTGATQRIDVYRTPNQDGTNFGALTAKMRYRSTNWGYHRAFWEITENFGTGTFYPFISRAELSPHRTFMALWLRGGLSYSFHYSSVETIIDGRAVAAKMGPGVAGDGSSDSWVSNVNTTQLFSTTGVTVPSNSWYLQTHYGSKGYDLGSSSFRWQGCFASAKDISSDERFKDNFGVSFGTSFLEKLNPVSYQWKNSKDRRRHTGFIAQEVKEIMDELGISEHEFAGYEGRNIDHLALSYDQFLPIIINAIQDADTEITDLKNRLIVLEQRNGII